MKTKLPFEFDITPDKIMTGTHWVTVHLKNLSKDTINNIEIKLHSIDPYFVSVLGTGKYIPEILPSEKKTMPFQLDATISTELFVTIDGVRAEEDFFWDSPTIEIDVGVTSARLRNVIAMTHPHVMLDDTIEAEAIVEGIEGGEDLNLTFWMDAPSSHKKIGSGDIGSMDPGEVARKSIEVTPQEPGMHKIITYLYEGTKYIGKKTETIWVKK